MSMSEFRSIGFAPLTCALLGGVLTLGTVVGQHKSAPDEPATNPMAGMDHSKMAGMVHAAAPGMDPNMPGMTHEATSGMDPDMPGMTSSGPASAAADAPAMAAPARPAPARDMSAPGMAAAMPGGFHSSCASRSTCTVLFARDASGVASVLGVHARLQKFTPTVVHVLVDDKPLLLRPGKTVHAHGLSIRLMKVDAKEASVRFRKAG